MNTRFHPNLIVRLLAVAAILAGAVILVFGSLFVVSPATAAPAAAPTLTGAQAVGATGGAFNCAGWTVTVPANVVPNGGLIHCGYFDPNFAPAAPVSYTLLRHTINVNIYDNNGQWITNFNPPLTVCYPYSDTELAAAGKDVRNFSVLTAPVNGIWSVLLTEETPQTHLACARTNHLSLFDLALAGAPKVALPTPATAAAFSTTAPSTVFITFAYSYAYTVQPGDTLFRIALNFNTSVYAIQLANGLSSNFIFAGERLIIPTNVKYLGTATTVIFGPTPTARPTAVTQATTYVVQAGDNLFRLSLRFKTTIAAIQAANGLTSTFIYVGQVLIIPTK